MMESAPTVTALDSIAIATHHAFMKPATKKKQNNARLPMQRQMVSGRKEGLP